MMFYFDNAATTQMSEVAIKALMDVSQNYYGNASSIYNYGRRSKAILTDAREIIAKSIGAKATEIFFTSCGTESDNWALIGTAMANRRAGKHIITTAIEHAAVLQPMLYLQEQGFEITFLPVDETGLISLEELKEALREDTILVSIMYVNNEVGAREPVEEAAELVHRLAPKAWFHTDAIQAYGKYQIRPKKAGIDLLSVSGHKIHGPKGSGFLYINEKVKIHPLILGGGQQKGMRSGTDNVPGIAGLGAAAADCYKDFEEKQKKLRALRNYFIEEMEKLPDIQVNGPKEEEKAAPQIVSVSFRGVRSEVLLHALEERGIYVSSGSACSSNKKLPVSAVLKEIHLESDLLDSTLRFSFCNETTKEELDYCLENLKELLPVLRKYARH